MTALSRFYAAVILASVLCASSSAQTQSYAGTYAADLPTASGCGRRVLLELFEDESYLFVQRHLCRPWSDAQITTGIWMIDDDHLVLSSVGNEMQFSLGGEQVDYVGTRYGQASLHLKRLK